jgi:hypothetical protein
VNTPTRHAVDALLVAMGGDSTQLGNGSIGLVKSPFSPDPALTLADLDEADYSGYARQGIGHPTIPFTSTDGLEYVEGTTCRFMPSDTTTPNTIYGMFLTTGSGTTTLWASDAFDNPIFLTGPSRQVTITPRVGLNPAGNFGLNVIST